VVVGGVAGDKRDRFVVRDIELFAGPIAFAINAVDVGATLDILERRQQQMVLRSVKRLRLQH
jgi:hypothetical protein